MVRTKKRENNSDNNNGTFSIVRPDGQVLAEFSPEATFDPEGTQMWLQYGLDLKARKFSLTGEVNENMSEFVLRAITKLDEVNQDPIHIHLQTFGGGVYEGLAIYDHLRAAKSPIIISANGKIASMGVIIFLAGTQRLATPNTRFMIHSVSHGTEGKLKDTLIDIAEAKIINDQLFKIIAERSNLNLKSLNKINGDFWFGYNDAKKFGILKDLPKKIKRKKRA